MKILIFIVLLLLTNIGFSQSTAEFQVGKTKCRIYIDKDNLTGICTWENGTVTKLIYVKEDIPSAYYYDEYKDDKYSGRFYLYAMERGYYLSDCDECNGKKYILYWQGN